MKILKTGLAAFGLLAALIQSDANADHHLYLAPEVAYVLPTDGDVDDTVFIGAKAGYKLDENLALELESGWAEYGWDATDDVKNVDVESVPVLFNVRFGERCSKEEAGWYTYAGIGAAFNNLQGNDYGAEVDNSFIWQVGAGLELPVSEGLDAFVDVRYLWNRADLDAPEVVKAATSDEVDLSSVFFTAGLKF